MDNEFKELHIKVSNLLDKMNVLMHNSHKISLDKTNYSELYGQYLALISKISEIRSERGQIKN